MLLCGLKLDLGRVDRSGGSNSCCCQWKGTAFSTSTDHLPKVESQNSAETCSRKAGSSTLSRISPFDWVGGQEQSKTNPDGDVLFSLALNALYRVQVLWGWGSFLLVHLPGAQNLRPCFSRVDFDAGMGLPELFPAYCG